MIDGGLPTRHFVAKPLLIIAVDLRISLGGEASVGISDRRLSRIRSFLFQRDLDLGCHDLRMNPCECNLEVGRIVFRHGPNGLGAVGIRRNKDTTHLCHASFRIDQPILPTRHPLRFANRAEQWKHLSRYCGVGLDKFMSNALRAKFHRFPSKRKWPTRKAWAVCRNLIMTLSSRPVK